MSRFPSLGSFLAVKEQSNNCTVSPRRKKKSARALQRSLYSSNKGSEPGESLKPTPTRTPPKRYVLKTTPILTHVTEPYTVKIETIEVGTATPSMDAGSVNAPAPTPPHPDPIAKIMNNPRMMDEITDKLSVAVDEKLEKDAKKRKLKELRTVETEKTKRKRK